MSKAKNLRGQVRVAKHDGIIWHGFNLRKNHFYGETEDGLRFVSACRIDSFGDVIVYIQYDEERNDWRVDHFAQDSVLGSMIIEKCKERDQAGGGNVQVPVVPSRGVLSRMMKRNCRYSTSNARMFA